MKLLFASDIHGSEYYTKLLLSKYQEEEATKLVLLGDLLYHGPRNPLTKDYNPQNVANLLNKHKSNIIAVRGNCDSEVDQMVLDFTMMNDYTDIYVDDYRFFLTHGHIFDNEKLPLINKRNIFVFGHIHIPILEYKDDVLILNPGSISLPKENNPSSYAIYENGSIEIKSFQGDTIKTIELK